MSKRKPFNVLFLCTGNSARSILSEAILNDVGFGRFLAFSAGSKPSGTPHPEGLAELQKRGHAANLYRSKNDGFTVRNFDVSHLNPGIYMFTARSDQKHVSLKFVKQ